jgi:hypothetical protein
VREEVLKHIGTQAKVQAAHMSLGTRAGRGRSDKAWRKILSDVDDTLSCSGGRFPAGVDSSYPRKQGQFCRLTFTGSVLLGETLHLQLCALSCSVVVLQTGVLLHMQVECTGVRCDTNTL